MKMLCEWKGPEAGIRAAEPVFLIKKEQSNAKFAKKACQNLSNHGIINSINFKREVCYER